MTFGYGNDSVVIWEHQLELHDRRLKILLVAFLFMTIFSFLSPFFRVVCAKAQTTFLHKVKEEMSETNEPAETEEPEMSM